MADITAARIIIPVSTNAAKAAKDVGKLDKSLKKTSKTTKGVSGGFTKAQKGAFDFGTAMKRITAGSIVIGIAMIGKELINLASDAEEVGNKFNVTFKEVQIAANIAANQLADGFGLATVEAQKLLSNTGDLLAGFGLTGKESLKLSTELNTLAADLASFTNIEGGTERASAALQSALLGEREAAKSLGIVISENAVQAELAARGQKNLTGNALLQAKAFATLKIAQEQSKNALGDFERSQDSFANVSKTVNSQIKDLGTELGQVLIPVFKDALIVVRNFLKTFQDQIKARKLDKLEVTSGLKVQEFLLKNLRENIRLGRLNIAMMQNGTMAAGRLGIEQKDLAENLKKLGLALDELRVKQDDVTQAHNAGFTSIEAYRKALKKQNAETKEGNKQRRLTADQIKEIIALRMRGLSILSESGSLASRLILQDRKAASERATLIKAGMDSAEQLTTFERSKLSERSKAINKFIQESINVEGAGFEQRQNMLAEAFEQTKGIDSLEKNERLAAQEAFNQASIQLEMERVQAIASQILTLAAVGQQVGQIFSNLAQVRRNQMQQEIADAQASSDAQIAAMEASGASQADIDTFRAQSEADLEKKRRALARKSAKDQKKFGRISIILDTATAIAKTAAQLGYPAAIPFIIAAGAIGATQLAVNESTPVPAQFGGSFTVPPGNEADSGLLAVNSGEQVDVTPVRESGNGGGSGPTILQVGQRDMEAWVVDAMNRNLNNGKVLISNPGTIRTA